MGAGDPVEAVAGFDAGGTHTVCRIATLQGATLGEGEAGPANHWAVGMSAASRSLRRSFEAAMASVPHPCHVRAAFIASSGYEPGDSQERVAALWRGWLAAPAVRVDTDVLATWAAAHALRPGAVVVAGTGSIALAVEGSGRRIYAGGWGHLLGDEGSAYDVAQLALRHLIAVEEGRMPTGELHRLLTHRLLPERRTSVRRALVEWVYERPDEAKPRIASLAPVVAEAARTGDPVARAILARSSARLARTLGCVLRRASLPKTAPIGVAGGMFACDLYLELFRRAVHRLIGERTVRRIEEPSVEGAVLLARGLAGAVPLPPRLFE